MESRLLEVPNGPHGCKTFSIRSSTLASAGPSCYTGWLPPATDCTTFLASFHTKKATGRLNDRQIVIFRGCCSVLYYTSRLLEAPWACTNAKVYGMEFSWALLLYASVLRADYLRVSSAQANDANARFCRDKNDSMLSLIRSVNPETLFSRPSSVALLLMWHAATALLLALLVQTTKQML